MSDLIEGEASVVAAELTTAQNKGGMLIGHDPLGRGHGPHSAIRVLMRAVRELNRIRWREGLPEYTGLTRQAVDEAVAAGLLNPDGLASSGAPVNAPSLPPPPWQPDPLLRLPQPGEARPLGAKSRRQ